MHLLRFTFENHRSFRDEATLDLTRPTLKTLRPPKGTEWTEHIHHVDGIYGANASGKTNVLDALHFVARAPSLPSSTVRPHAAVRISSRHIRARVHS